jgi:hypothetical protein
MKEWLSWLLGRSSEAKQASTTGPSHANSALAQVKWLEPNEGPFGIEVLDCSSYATSMLSTTSDPQIAQRYCTLRDSSGEEFRGKSPRDGRKVFCNLTYPVSQAPDQGPLFKAQQMEDKWDIYFYDTYLYFTRSWTGDLVFLAEIRFAEGQARITLVETRWKDDEDQFVVQQVDFLVKSHLLGLVSLHPLPKSRRMDSLEVLTAFSFARFGRRGLYGTFQDTLTTKVMPRS